MSGIFLNDPKVPKGGWFYFKLTVISILIVLQLALIIYLYHDSVDKQEAARNTTIATVAPTPAPTVAPPPRAQSIEDEEMAALVEDYFGPLPRVINNPPDLKTLYPVKGIYLGAAHNLEAALNLAQKTEVNAFVIDLKESWGLTYPSKVPLAVEIGAASGTMDFARVAEKCHAANVKVIARIVCFKDEVMPQRKPELCLTSENGELLHYPLEGGLAFADPYDKRVWAYLIEIAKEAVSLGADEIQFDYVRFPTGRPQEEGNPEHQALEEKIPKEYAINRFLETARIEIQENLGIPVSADLFSIVMTSSMDGLLIGQNWATIGLTGIDNLCPMIYPSHYANASQGSQGNGEGSYIGRAFFTAPDTEPQAVVENAIIDGLEASRQAGYARLRPWLQAFTASWLPAGYYIEYGPTEIREQIAAVYAANYGEWILWNAEHSYPEEAFLNKEEAAIQESQLIESSKAEEQSLAEQREEKAQETTRRFPIATPAPEAD